MTTAVSATDSSSAATSTLPDGQKTENVLCGRRSYFGLLAPDNSVTYWKGEALWNATPITPASAEKIPASVLADIDQQIEQLRTGQGT